MTKADRRAAICAEAIRLLTEERRRRGLSKNSLAALTGLNQSTVSRLDNHPQNPTLDSLLRVADELQVNLGEILRQAIENVGSARPAKPHK